MTTLIKAFFAFAKSNPSTIYLIPLGVIKVKIVLAIAWLQS